MKEETYILLAGFNLIDLAKKHLPAGSFDKYSKKNQNVQAKFKGLLQYWRIDNSIPSDFYSTLSQIYPDPIPSLLFFSYSGLSNIKNIKWIGDLADKWLADIFSGGSFYEKNKEYFARAEVKPFLTCARRKRLQTCGYTDLTYHFFDVKIKANNLGLSPSTLYRTFNIFFSNNRILKDSIIFIQTNKKYLKTEELRSIGEYVYSEYISKGKDFDFTKHTYKSLRLLTDAWYVSCYFSGMNMESKTTQDYIQFICEKLVRENIKKHGKSEITDFGYYFRKIWKANKSKLDDDDDYFEDDNYDSSAIYPLFIHNDENVIYDIYDYLRNEYINAGIDFDFNHRTWRNLKRLSDIWHEDVRPKEAEKPKDSLDANWERSGIKDFIYKKDGKIWTITEITSGKLLYEEGQIMGHCCFEYLQDCIDKKSMIFSVKCGRGGKLSDERVATIEIANYGVLKQVRGKENSSVDKETKKIIHLWVTENSSRLESMLQGKKIIYV